jgi:hypothetical protein
VGQTVTPSLPFLSHLWESLVHPSRTLRKGSGWVDLVVHVSAPCALRPPQRTVIEDTWRTFFTHARDVRSNTVNSRGARPLGPRAVRSCQCQAILTEDGMTARRSQASSLMSFSVRLFPFDPKDNLDNEFSHFQGMSFSNSNFFGIRCLVKSFALFMQFGHKSCLFERSCSLLEVLV